MKKVDSKKCTFCNMYSEKLLHLFYDCIHVKPVLFRVQEIFKQLDNGVNVLTEKNVILGFELENLSKSNLDLNNMLLHFKMYVWKCRCLSVEPSYSNFRKYVEDRKLFESCLEEVVLWNVIPCLRCLSLCVYLVLGWVNVCVKGFSIWCNFYMCNQ